MKQIEKTPEIVAKLRASAGADVDVNRLAVFEAVALNTLPLRKQHPTYKGARADISLLREMAEFMNKESVPVNFQHDGSMLPVGRAFSAQLINNGGDVELRSLFFIDASEAETVAKIDNGVIDQVSVGILPKHLYSSVTGFDFIGSDASAENFWTGTDPDGNVMGEGGAFARMVGLDAFFELSLVSQGGARGARIVQRDQASFGSSYTRLAASGVDPNLFVLTATASQKEPDMDLTTLIKELTDTKVELATVKADAAAKDASLAAKDAEIAELKAAAKPELQSQLDAATAQLAAVDTAIRAEATRVLTAAGKVGVELPGELPAVITLMNETSTAFAASLANRGQSRGTETDVEPKTSRSLSAFRTRQ